MTASRPGLLQRVTRTQTQVDADRLEDEARDRGARHVRDRVGGSTTTVPGRLRPVALRPVATVPALPAQPGDGTGRLARLRRGPRRIPGITPGRHVVAPRRPLVRDGAPATLTPRYQLLATVPE